MEVILFSRSILRILKTRTYKMAVLSSLFSSRIAFYWGGSFEDFQAIRLALGAVAEHFSMSFVVLYCRGFAILSRKTSLDLLNSRTLVDTALPVAACVSEAFVEAST